MKVGRPSKNVKSDLHIRLDEETMSKLVFLADKEKVSVSEYVRKVLKKAT